MYQKLAAKQNYKNALNFKYFFNNVESILVVPKY